jgi:hypothetical protein
MRITIAIAAAALVAGSPAWAQNDTANTAATDVNVVAMDANAMTPIDNATVPVATTTDTTTVETTEPAPVPEERHHGFPWGVLGLLGLLGLIPRLRRG